MASQIQQFTINLKTKERKSFQVESKFFLQVKGSVQFKEKNSLPCEKFARPVKHLLDKAAHYIA
jgi:hypothetical protein